MNTKITALKKKIELKEGQLKSKEELAVRCKETIKEIKYEIELLNNELAKEEMQEMLDLMGEKNLNIDDVKAAIVSGVITSTVSAEINEEKADTKSENEEQTISEQIEAINMEENANV